MAKGWGVHAAHDDRYAFLSGELELAFYDPRTDSPTAGQVSRLVLSALHRTLLLIPRGVWHAERNLGQADVQVVNFPSAPYDHANPDKHKLPLDTDQLPVTRSAPVGWMVTTAAGSLAQISSTLVQRLIVGPDAAIASARLAARVAVVSGVVFVIAGLVKFVFHSWELNAFRSFGLPWPSALEILAGVLEVIGGVLLVLRRWVVPAAGLLALTMVVAIGASGVGHGDVIPSLTLAPALLVAMLYLLGVARVSRSWPSL